MSFKTEDKVKMFVKQKKKESITRKLILQEALERSPADSTVTSGRELDILIEMS